MMVTKTQIIRRVLEILGVVGAGQTVAPEDHQSVEETLRAVIASLDSRYIVSLRSEFAADEFPDDLMLPLATIVARHAAPSFGFAGQELAALKMLADDAELEICAQLQSGRGVQPTPGTYF